ncbi:MAG: phosphate ABC transporter substrate-binding protein [Firmicutes bacterium]|nr:phosphate ABC transporter substrate-binding protein [Bacillota bacterium]MCL5039383.1 phosphate ABC transporter substrate-binding protein [Bacillota bacterium]
MIISRSFRVFAAVLMVFSLLVAGCGAKKSTPEQTLSGKVTLSGSTALLPMAKQAADLFMQKNKGVLINVSGGGSFTGLNQVAAGNVDIGMSDVFATSEYKDKGLVDFQVSVAPFILVVNPSVTVENLTEAQARDIFTGKVTNWKEVGGKDEKITVVTRTKASGSRATITDIVLKGQDFTTGAVVQDSNGALREVVAKTPGAIGFVDAAYVNDAVKTLAYNGVKYTPENVSTGKYVIWTYEHLYSKGEPKGATKAFIDYILNAEFQNKYVEQTGFIPVSKMQVKK